MSHALMKFVDHRDDCDWVQPMCHQGPCDCGLHGALSALTQEDLVALESARPGIVAGWRRATAPVAPPTHVIDQSGQPYGSVRRCCNQCGAMAVPGMIVVESVAEWRDLPPERRCDRRIMKPACSGHQRSVLGETMLASPDGPEMRAFIARLRQENPSDETPDDELRQTVIESLKSACSADREKQ